MLQRNLEQRQHQRKISTNLGTWKEERTDFCVGSWSSGDGVRECGHGVAEATSFFLFPYIQETAHPTCEGDCRLVPSEHS